MRPALAVLARELAPTSGSGGPFESLFDPRAGDDRVAIAEAHPGSKGAVLVPEPAELGVEPADLFLDLGGVLRGQAMPELAALFAQALDLRVNGGESIHVSNNGAHCRRIPR